MDVHIGEMTSTVKATDSESLLDPKVLEKIVQAACERLRGELDRERRAGEERRMAPSSAPEERIGGGPGGGW